MTETPPLTVVFDLDGTLVETAPDLIDALTVSLHAEGVAPLPYEQARDLIGAGALALVKRGLEVAGREVSDDRLGELHAIFLEHYAAHIADKSEAFPGCEAELDRLARKGAKLAVCTNKIERFAVQLLERLGLAHRFDAIVGGDTYGVGKPDPAPLLGAIERAGGDPRRSVMVGDSSTDVDAARNAGVPCVVATFGYTLIPPRELGGQATFDRYDELPSAIATALAAPSR